MMFGPNALKSLTGDLDKVGRRIATTFSGFCGNHDTKLFSYIENKDYITNDKKQEFLFAYRALCRELIVKEEQRNIFKYLLDSYSFPNGKEWVSAITMGLSDITTIKDFLDENMLNEKFDTIDTIPIILDKKCRFSVTSVFHLEFDFKNNIVNNLSNPDERAKPLFLTVFPQNNKTCILLSYLKKDAEEYKPFKEQILEFSNEEITEKISLLITLYCENFAYSPEKWDSLDKESRRKFMEIFDESINGDKLRHMNFKPPLIFFQ